MISPQLIRHCSLVYYLRFTFRTGIHRLRLLLRDHFCHLISCHRFQRQSLSILRWRGDMVGHPRSWWFNEGLLVRRRSYRWIRAGWELMFHRRSQNDVHWLTGITVGFNQNLLQWVAIEGGLLHLFPFDERSHFLFELRRGCPGSRSFALRWCRIREEWS